MEYGVAAVPYKSPHVHVPVDEIVSSERRPFKVFCPGCGQPQSLYLEAVQRGSWSTAFQDDGGVQFLVICSSFTTPVPFQGDVVYQGTNRSRKS